MAVLTAVSIFTATTITEVQAERAVTVSGLLAEEETTEAVAPDIPDLYAGAALLMDADSGRILYEENGHELMPMASTTKIMTCIIALEYGNLDSEVIVTANAASQPKVHLGMQAEERYLLKDLLYSLMLESHNDSAVAIAEHVGGSVEEFAVLMNQKARDVGAYETNFVTPNGLDADGHQTTAAELAIITRYAIANEQFREIIATESYSFSTTDGSRSFTATNKDSFLQQMEGAFGVKTGFTNNAGYCFVGALERDGRTYISVVLACGWPPNKTWKWSDTKALMTYGIEHYTVQKLFEPVADFTMIAVENGQKKETGTYIDGDLDMILAEWDQVETYYNYSEHIRAPVEKDQTIGFVRIEVNGESVWKAPIKIAEAVPERDFGYWWEQVWTKFLLMW